MYQNFSTAGFAPLGADAGVPAPPAPTDAAPSPEYLAMISQTEAERQRRLKYTPKWKGWATAGGIVALGGILYYLGGKEGLKSFRGRWKTADGSEIGFSEPEPVQTGKQIKLTPAQSVLMLGGFAGLMYVVYRIAMKQKGSSSWVNPVLRR